VTREPGIDVADLLPQEGAARLVERLIERLPDGVRCRGRVPAGSPLAHDGIAAAPAAIELAAQAAGVDAALARARGRPEEAVGPSRVAGYLVGVRAFRADSGGFPAGAEVEVEALRDGVAGPLAVYRARIRWLGRTIAAGDVLIWDASGGG